MRVDMHQRPVNYKTAARSFCKQTCFSRSYFWDRKLSCKVASLQWASLVLAGGSLRNSSHLAGGLGASKHKIVRRKGAWEWVSVIPGCGIYGELNA